jgi:ATP adenylyltransferase
MENLWQRMSAVADRAIASGQLVIRPSEYEIISQGGIDFVVRYAPSVAIEKPTTASPANPFLTPDPALWVETLGQSHHLLLNKYSLLPLHGLITTQGFVEQTGLLNLADFSAIAMVLDQVDGLVFYNGGPLAGASLAHRHFQLVPKDLGAGVLPIDAAVLRWQQDSHQSIYPFVHRVHWLPNWQPDTLLEAWQKLEYSWQACNLLITRNWMLVVPRTQASVGALAINSLGLAGGLLAQDPAQRALIRRSGPMALLHQVCRSHQ